MSETEGKNRGGRPKGSPNKKTEHLLAKCEELGFDPFVTLIHFARGDWNALGYPEAHRVKYVAEGGTEVLEDVISVEIRQSSVRELCQYLYPKRKALELASDEDKGFKVIIEDYSSGK